MAREPKMVNTATQPSPTACLALNFGSSVTIDKLKLVVGGGRGGPEVAFTLGVLECANKTNLAEVPTRHCPTARGRLCSLQEAPQS